jgi:hypothetical protein
MNITVDGDEGEVDGVGQVVEDGGEDEGVEGGSGSKCAWIVNERVGKGVVGGIVTVRDGGVCYSP